MDLGIDIAFDGGILFTRILEIPSAYYRGSDSKAETYPCGHASSDAGVDILINDRSDIITGRVQPQCIVPFSSGEGTSDSVHPLV